MSYQTALTINRVIKDIDAKKYLLPSIQREFVWNTDQIEKLFDSLMMDYPINSFLFWKVSKENTKEFKFYEFLREYHQRENRHNPKADLNGSDDIMAILDGQQRMTSLYIGLKGTYAYKLSYKRWDNPLAYPKRRLYLNLLQPAEEREDFKYDFLFLTEDEVREDHAYRDEDGKRHYFWFPVGEILNFTKSNEVNKYLIKNKLHSLEDEEQALFANDALFNLFEAIHMKETISYYLEESQELDKVLHIFIRVNSGGTPLSYSDLLLSFATAQWEKLDAREEINGAVDELNKIGRGFHITKDLLLKASLVLCDFSDIRFKADNFNQTNMLVIERKWDSITSSMRLAMELVASFGFSRENITSNNALIPIAYYISVIGNPANFASSGKYKEDRKKIKKWFASSILLRVFSFASDSVLKQIREIVRGRHEGFPLDAICDKFRGTNRDITFTHDSINNLLWTKYGEGDALIVMSFLYPWASLKNNFHIDHIHPKSKFTRKKLEKYGVPEDQVDFYMDNYNYIGNLQLLEEVQNEEKSARYFDEWMEEQFPDPGQRKDYMQKHLIPDVDFSIRNFKEFFTEREKLLCNALKKELMQTKE